LVLIFQHHGELIWDWTVLPPDKKSSFNRGPNMRLVLFFEEPKEESGKTIVH
jgi:hypothetical protein